MELLYWLHGIVRMLGLPLLIEAPILVPLVVFGITWVHRAPWVSLPARGERRDLLTCIGLFGSLAVVLVSATVGLIAALEGYDSTGIAGWWRRPAPILTAAIVIGIAIVVLRREPVAAPGERAIAPRRRWWDFAPKAPLWIGISAAALLALTSLWQGFRTSLLPASLDTTVTYYDQGDPAETTDILQHDNLLEQLPNGPFFDNPSGGGWLNNGVALTVLAILVLLLFFALSSDANRPVRVRASAPSVRETRQVTAKMLVLIALGAVLVTLGMLWMFVGYLGQWGVTVAASTIGPDGPDPLGAQPGVMIGTDYAAFAGVFSYAGMLLQGIGSGLLLRLAFDTVRARRRLDRMRRADGPDPETVLAGSVERTEYIDSTADTPDKSTGSNEPTASSAPHAETDR